MPKGSYLYRVNTNQIGSMFRENGSRNGYYEYETPFYGAVIRSHKPLPVLDETMVVLLVHARHSDGKFSGITLEILPQDDKKLARYKINPADLHQVNIDLQKLDGNIIINDIPSVASMFIYDWKKRESAMINLVPVTKE